MESSDLNAPSDHPADDAALEALLRHAGPPLPDDGFSLRVLAALPPREPALLAWRAPILAGTAVAGLALVLARIATTGGLAVAAAQLDASLGQIHHALHQNADPAVDPALAFALIATAASLLYAFRDELRRRLPL